MDTSDLNKKINILTRENKELKKKITKLEVLIKENITQRLEDIIKILRNDLY